MKYRFINTGYFNTANGDLKLKELTESEKKILKLKEEIVLTKMEIEELNTKYYHASFGDNFACGMLAIMGVLAVFNGAMCISEHLGFGMWLGYTFSMSILASPLAYFVGKGITSDHDLNIQYAIKEKQTELARLQQSLISARYAISNINFDIQRDIETNNLNYANPLEIIGEPNDELMTKAEVEKIKTKLMEEKKLH